MTKIVLDCRKGIVLDWNDGRHWNSKRTACIYCGRLSFLVDDAGRPAHKTCAQSALAALINKRNEKAAA